MAKRRDPLAKDRLDKSLVEVLGKKVKTPSATGKKRQSPPPESALVDILPKDKVMRVKCDRVEFAENEALVAEVSKLVDCKVTASDLMRVTWALVKLSKEELRDVPAPKLRRPPNSNPARIAEFDKELEVFLHRAIRKTKVDS